MGHPDDKEYYRKWESLYWHQTVCYFCGKIMKREDTDYCYRQAYVDASGHNNDVCACKACIENDTLRPTATEEDP